MDEIKKDIRIIRESQIRMEGDLKYHIKRTDVLEDRDIGVVCTVKSTFQKLLVIDCNRSNW